MLSFVAQPAAPSVPVETIASDLWSLDRSAFQPKASTLEHKDTPTHEHESKYNIHYIPIQIHVFNFTL